ncbi:hypothetical protein ACP275_08G251400 [Erythranthe tilingii]
MKIPEIIKLSTYSHEPEHGSKLKLVSNSGLKISISVGVLGAAVIALALKFTRFIDFSSSYEEFDSPRFWVVPGLENLGNNCFLNVVLQALASCTSFRKYLDEMVKEYGSLSVEERDENIPLVNALTSLVEELSTVRDKNTTLSPRKLMVAMDRYIPNFNLTSQQDAEEAFSRLLSSLREEISECCVPQNSSLADLPVVSNSRIVTTKSNEKESELQKWNRSFLKPFDGILGSILVCQSCSFQISLDFQLFHSLHLSPPLSSDETIMDGCTLEDCLKQFFVAEHIENYCCSNCWHTAAIDYLSVFSSDKTDIEKLKRCNKNDSCDCKKISSLESFPWLNRFSRTFKQMSIARSPKILCIHLPRASYNMFGESVKLLGHISFPSILDLSPFMNTGVEIKNTEPNLQISPLNRRSREIRSFTYSNYQNLLLDPAKLNCKSTTEKSISSETMLEGPEASKPSSSDSTKSADGNMDVNLRLSPVRHQMYRLVSVVVHYGGGGGGHYTVYRKVRAKLGDENNFVALLESSIEQWFSISDSQVLSVSERDVFDANASMLFYEKIENS